ncbi:MAG: DUF5060 domain-containing protein [Anaerolineae bacterium]|nr:DUF5060 domain-containing protein [Anaerolineae bacterium]
MTGQVPHVERWGIHEIVLQGPQEGNPFLEVSLSAEFAYGHRVVPVDGFYDGDGVYRIRFMPDTPGTWRYVTRSNAPALDGRTGELLCTDPSPGNHGPVRVRGTYHFAYGDGAPYFPIGTTCYAWVHQGDALEEQTLATLRGSPFNKLRMCVFPKDYAYNKNEPVYYPFEPGPSGGWDLTRFSPPFFRHLEQRIGQLRDLGIEADLILFHPYDRWGYSDMGAEADDRYLRYVVARLSAFRNVWWSLANEFDIMRSKTLADWDRFFRIVQESDPYQHLRSVHNCHTFYDHARPWVTHCSVQHSDLGRVREWRSLYGKPVIVDECCYEGNIEENWGNISARELVHRFWLGTVGGGYVGHGETYRHPDDILWWSKGGVLHGESPARIAFLRRILEEGPEGGLEPIIANWREQAAGREGEYYLFYFGLHQPAWHTFELPAGTYAAEIIDPWEMTITPVPGICEGHFRLELPGRPYLAVRFRRVS